jgi:hypothetical protein
METEHLVNLTGHHITIVDWDERIVAQLPPLYGHKTAKPALQFERPERLEPGEVWEDIQVRDVAVSHIKNLPENLDPDKTYIVGAQTAVVASYLFEHDNVIMPDLGSTAIRDENGKVIGVRRFLRYVEQVEQPVGGAWAGDASKD